MLHKALAGVALLGVMVAGATDVQAQRKRTTRVVQQGAPRRTPTRIIAVEPALPARTLYVHTLAQVGRPLGIGLDGARDQQVVTFRLPAPAPVVDGRLALKLHFGAALIPQSNVQVYANGTRLTAVSRADADAHGDVAIDLPIPSSALSGGYLAASFRSSLATMADRCLDARLGLPHVQIDADSKFSYSLAADAVTTVQTALAVLPDTVTLALPARKLAPFEFASAFSAATELGRQGFAVAYTQLPQLGDIAIATAAEIAAVEGVVEPPAAAANVSLFKYGPAGNQHTAVAITSDTNGAGVAMFAQAWSPLANTPSLAVRTARGDTRVTVNDPTFAELRLPDLQQDIGAEATWRLGIDIRDFPPGRVPTHIDLALATAPNTNRRQLVVFVFWNGTLVRSADIAGDGMPQNVAVDLPGSLLSTRNELRVTMQRHIEGAEGCAFADASIPAQILPSSRLITSAASTSVEAFDGVAARLSAASSLYLPSDALEHAEQYLPMLTSVGRAFWISPRVPRAVFYGATAPPPPTGAFVLVGAPANAAIDAPLTARTGRLTIHRKETHDTIFDVADLATWSVAQVVKWNGQVGVQLLPTKNDGHLPAYPEAYGSSNLLLAHGDSTLFPLNTTGVAGIIVINEGPTIWVRLQRDWMLWAVFLTLLIVVPVVLLLRAILRRTPRRDVRRPATSTYPTRPITGSHPTTAERPTPSRSSTPTRPPSVGT